MPLTSKNFYGDIRVGDFKLQPAQMDEILEPEPFIPLERQFIAEVVSQSNAENRIMLSMADLSDFKAIKIQKESTYHADEYLLYARNIEGRSAPDNQLANHRMSMKRNKRARKIESSEVNDNSESMIDSFLGFDQQMDAF